MSAQRAEVRVEDQAEVMGTRERILEVAMELFTEKGYDKTSLREIAERLGFTKAALYYHFESKEDILRALHMRLHEFGRDALMGLGPEPVTLEQWEELTDGLIEQMIAQRPIFMLHERNQAAVESLHSDAHDADHEDLQAAFTRVFNDKRVPIENRVKMASAFGALVGGLFVSGEAFMDVPADEMATMLRDAVHRLLH
ncbi:MAG TPA: helix-turn-helix domain-containing protein [Acidimicrobiales bacterium]